MPGTRRSGSAGAAPPPQRSGQNLEFSGALSAVCSSIPQPRLSHVSPAEREKG